MRCFRVLGGRRSYSTPQIRASGASRRMRAMTRATWGGGTEEKMMTRSGLPGISVGSAIINQKSRLEITTIEINVDGNHVASLACETRRPVSLHYLIFPL